MNCKFLDWGLTLAIVGVVVTGFAQTWTSTNTVSTHLFIASSADGRVLMAIGSTVKPLFSTNSGVAWSTNAAWPDGFLSAAISADGTKLWVPSFNSSSLYLSTNTGNTWLQTSAPKNYWQSVACSADGSILFAGVDLGGVWFSTNSGTTWQQTSLPSTRWPSIAITADGGKLAACGGVQIYVSTNAGYNWQSAAVTGTSVAASADGGVLIVTGNGSTYISTNFGGTWRTNAINGGAASGAAGNSIAISADGKYLALADINNKIYTSIDSGATWLTNNTVPSSWFGITSSADGHRLFAVSHFSSAIWIGQYAPSPQLNLASTGGGIGLSWTIPSTNFVLQQSPDLNSWSVVTNTPVLNLTNLQNQVALPVLTGNAFFRLSTP